MKKFALAIVLALHSTCFAGPVRSWKDSTGKFEIEAEFISANSKEVVLKKTDGSTITIPISRLSVADAEYVAEAAHRGSHKPSSAGRVTAGKAALDFLAKHRFESLPDGMSADDALAWACAEGMAILALGESESHRKRLDDCYKFVAKDARLRSLGAAVDKRPSTRSASYALMFSTEYALRLGSVSSKNLSKQIAEGLLEQQAAGGGWSTGGIAKVDNASGDGTSIALVALAAVEKLAVIDGAEAAKAGGVSFLKKCVNTTVVGSGIVTETANGDIRGFGTSPRSMISGSALSLSGESDSKEYASILARLDKLSGNMVNKLRGNLVSGHQKLVRDIEGEAFLSLLFHRASEEHSAKYWKERLVELRQFQQADGSFADPQRRGSPAGNVIAAAVNAQAAAAYEEQERLKQLPSSLQATAFRALTYLIPEGNLRIFADAR